MKDSEVIRTIAAAYLSSFRLERRHADFYWVSDMDPARREIVGTRDGSLRDSVVAFYHVMQSQEPMQFVDGEPHCNHDPAGLRRDSSGHVTNECECGARMPRAYVEAVELTYKWLDEPHAEDSMDATERDLEYFDSLTEVLGDMSADYFDTQRNSR